MQHAAASSISSQTPTRVLLVEDDTSTSRLIARTLRGQGYACDTAELGEEALDLIERHPYDIIVLDLMLPDIDGFEVIRRLRVPGVNTPILILSGLTGADDKLKGFGSGADDYLTKPFNTKELIARIEALVRRTKGDAAPGQILRPATATLQKGTAPAGEAGARAPLPARGARGKARVIVLGNEKGGSGKSTLAMHIVVALLREGRRVASVDLDVRQGTLTRYVENRRAYSVQRRLFLPMPTHLTLDHAEEDPEHLAEALAGLTDGHDYVVIDTPGSTSALSRLAHSWADTIITPINDSFLDVDVLARLEGETREFKKPGHYSEMVLEAKKARAARDGGSIEWIVLRNRLSNLDAANKREMADALQRLSGRLGFRGGPGLSERVIYRQMFHSGLTLLDLGEKISGVKLTMSRLAARQELRSLLELVR